MIRRAKIDDLVSAMEICQSRKRDEIHKQRQYKIEDSTYYKKSPLIN